MKRFGQTFWNVLAQRSWNVFAKRVIHVLFNIFSTRSKNVLISLSLIRSLSLALSICLFMYEQLHRVTTPTILSSKPLVLKMSVIMYGIYKSCSLGILEFWCKLLKWSNSLISLISLLSLTKLKRLWLKKKLQKIFRTLTYTRTGFHFQN